MVWALVSIMVLLAVVAFSAGFLIGAVLTSRQYDRAFYDRALERRDDGRPWAGGA